MKPYIGLIPTVHVLQEVIDEDIKNTGLLNVYTAAIASDTSYLGVLHGDKELFRVAFTWDKSKEFTPYEFTCTLPSEPEDIVIPIKISPEEDLRKHFIRTGINYLILKEISKLVP